MISGLYPAWVDPADVVPPPNHAEAAVAPQPAKLLSKPDAARRVSILTMSASIDLVKSANENLPVMAKFTTASSIELKALLNRVFVCPATSRACSR
ncbi:hypothetical protein D3C81_1706610 [compost metagenome]